MSTTIADQLDQRDIDEIVARIRTRYPDCPAEWWTKPAAEWGAIHRGVFNAEFCEGLRQPQRLMLPEGVDQ